MNTYRITFKTGKTIDIKGGLLRSNENFVAILDNDRQSQHLFAADSVLQVIRLGND